MRMRELDEFDFHATLADCPGVSLVMFSGPECRTCRRLEEMLPQLILDRTVNLYKVDVQKSMALARAFEVFHLPSLFVYVDSRYHGPLYAELTPEKFSRALTALLDAPAQEEP